MTRRLEYIPDLAIDHPIAVVLPVGDWLSFLTWVIADSTDTTGVEHIMPLLVNEQIIPKIFTQASIKAADAHWEEHKAQNANPFGRILAAVGFPGVGITEIDPSQFSEPGFLYGIECGVCGVVEEYEVLPSSTLNCGHNEGRLVSRRPRPEGNPDA